MSIRGFALAALLMTALPLGSDDLVRQWRQDLAEEGYDSHDELLALVRHGESTELRLKAAQVLFLVGEEEDAAVIAEVLHEATWSDNQRIVLARAVANLDREMGVKVGQDLLGYVRDREARLELMQLLAGLGKAPRYSELLGFLEGEVVEERELATRALGYLAAFPEGRTLKPRPLTRLVALTEDESDAVQEVAVESLGRLFVASDMSPQEREEIRRALCAWLAAKPEEGRVLQLHRWSESGLEDVDLGCAQENLDESCTASVFNAMAPVEPLGPSVRPNGASGMNQVPLRAACVEGGVPPGVRSDLYAMPADGLIRVPEVHFDDPVPGPQRLIVPGSPTTLTGADQVVPLNILALNPDGSSSDLWEMRASGSREAFVTPQPLVRGSLAAILARALVSGVIPAPVSGQGPDLDRTCKVLVLNTALEDAGSGGYTYACTDVHHLEWWQECAHALLQAVQKPSRTGDSWTVIEPQERWAPTDSFAERFVAECQALRVVAEAEGRPLVEGTLSFPQHDSSRCPCRIADHLDWVEECLSEIDGGLPGMRRWEVMERFGLDGGIHSFDQTRLRHCTCPMLKIDVGFDLAPGAREQNPGDIILDVSSPYLEYPISD